MVCTVCQSYALLMGVGNKVRAVAVALGTILVLGACSSSNSGDSGDGGDGGDSGDTDDPDDIPLDGATEDTPSSTCKKYGLSSVPGVAVKACTATIPGDNQAFIGQTNGAYKISVKNTGPAGAACNVINMIYSSSGVEPSGQRVVDSGDETTVCGDEQQAVVIVGTGGCEVAFDRIGESC